MKVRTRFAPSPTGSLHIGGIHNALFAYALAKHNNGDFVLRIEDTDQKRKVSGSIKEIIEMLDEFGLTPDEGPVQGGKYGPYIQSERVELGIYKERAEYLVKKGFAYYCFLTQNELNDLRKSKFKNKAFRSPYRNLDYNKARKRIEKGEKYVVRLKVPNNEIIIVEDAILGKIKWDSNEVDDQVLLKSDGFPTYHLAVVVDDYLMKITHITRSYEWLSSTPKHILLYKYFDYPLPVFAHSPLLLDPDGGKLSKRKGSVSAKDFLKEGYLPDAIKNFLMLLGWAPPIKRIHGEKEREIFTMEEFIKMYELKDRKKTNAVFNRNKLLWFNNQYIKNIKSENLVDKFIKWLNEFYKNDAVVNNINSDSPEFLVKKIALVKDRAKTLVEIKKQLEIFYNTPNFYEWSANKVKNYKDKITDILKDLDTLFRQDKVILEDKNLWYEKIKAISLKYNLKPGDAFMVLRIAITGKVVSPPLFELMQILKFKKVLNRIQVALEVYEINYE